MIQSMKFFKIISTVLCIAIFITNLISLGKDIYDAYPYRIVEECSYTFSEISNREYPKFFIKDASSENCHTDDKDIQSLVDDLNKSTYLPLNKSDGSKILWKHSKNDEILSIYWGDSSNDGTLRMFRLEENYNRADAMDFPVAYMYISNQDNNVYLIVHYQIYKDHLLQQYDIQHISGYNLQNGLENDYIWLCQVYKAEQPEKIINIVDRQEDSPKDVYTSSTPILTIYKNNVIYGLRGYYIYFTPTIITIVLSIIMYLILKVEILKKKLEKSVNSSLIDIN